MSDTMPTITLDMSLARMQHVLSRLTAFLLQEPYAFLQTFHGEQRTEIEIFLHASHPAVRLTLRVVETAETAGIVPAPVCEDPVQAETVAFLQRLLEVCAQ